MLWTSFFPTNDPYERSRRKHFPTNFGTAFIADKSFKMGKKRNSMMKKKKEKEFVVEKILKKRLRAGKVSETNFARKQLKVKKKLFSDRIFAQVEGL